MRLYCPNCKDYVFIIRNTSATVKCPRCFRRISGRKQREVWKELHNERQGRFDAVEDTLVERRNKRQSGTDFDD